MKTIKGNLLEQTTGIIVHGVNCQGVMGGGIAAQIRAKYPQVYKDYCAFYEQETTAPRFQTTAQLLGNVVYTQISDELIIASAFTQDFFGASKSTVYVSYVAVMQCFYKISTDQKTEANYGGGNRIIKFPMIGAGLANGDWSVISKIIDEQTQDLETELYVLS
jgi:O-acetyl-ADP-ribose deacetylase (regulator of RNase III)